MNGRGTSCDRLLARLTIDAFAKIRKNGVASRLQPFLALNQP